MFNDLICCPSYARLHCIFSTPIVHSLVKWLTSGSIAALPIGEYAAVALLTFFGLNSIKNAWELPSDAGKKNKENAELGEFVEAEELVKEKVSNRNKHLEWFI